jgi:hypothetical protein
MGVQGDDRRGASADGSSRRCPGGPPNGRQLGRSLTTRAQATSPILAVSLMSATSAFSSRSASFLNRTQALPMLASGSRSTFRCATLPVAERPSSTARCTMRCWRSTACRRRPHGRSQNGSERPATEHAAHDHRLELGRVPANQRIEGRDVDRRFVVHRGDELGRGLHVQLSLQLRVLRDSASPWAATPTTPMSGPTTLFGREPSQAGD